MKKKEVIGGKIDGFDKEHQHWEEKAEPKKSIYKSFSEITKLEADKMRLENNERPISEEGKQILNENVEESDLGRLERFKKWAKDNLLGLSAVAIVIAGIVTTIVIRVRSVANIAKKLGPLLSPILNLIAQILTWGAKGIAFLAKNLWILAIVPAYFLYNE